jgi:hypothetical protein
MRSSICVNIRRVLCFRHASFITDRTRAISEGASLALTPLTGDAITWDADIELS